jgi:hypothetical protein
MDAPEVERLRRMKALAGDLEAAEKASEKLRQSVAPGVTHARRSGIIRRQRPPSRTIPKV